MTKGQRLKNLIYKRRFNLGEIAKALEMNLSYILKPDNKNVHKTSIFGESAPNLHINVTYSFTKNKRNKTAIGNHSIAGNNNLLHDNLYVPLPPEGFIKIVTPDGRVTQVEALASTGTENFIIQELSKELEDNKNEVMKLQKRIIELQDYIISRRE